MTLHLTTTRWQRAPVAGPSDRLLFAIGDVHGQANHLAFLHDAVADEIARENMPASLIRLGDYIDRGPDSARVLDLAMAGLRLAGVTEYNIAGNHEHMMLDVLEPDYDTDAERALTLWALNGALPTITSLDVDPNLDPPALRTALRDALGRERLEFLQRLSAMVQVEKIVFVHAGVRPRVPLDKQDPADLAWIREPFLEHIGAYPGETAVVHGHTPGDPGIYDHRIAVDSGAFHTGALTAVEIRGPELRFLIATDGSTIP